MSAPLVCPPIREGALNRPKKPSGRHAARLRRDGITARLSCSFNFLATRVENRGTKTNAKARNDQSYSLQYRSVYVLGTTHSKPDAFRDCRYPGGSHAGDHILRSCKIY